MSQCSPLSDFDSIISSYLMDDLYHISWKHTYCAKVKGGKEEREERKGEKDKSKRLSIEAPPYSLPVILVCVHVCVCVVVFFQPCSSLICWRFRGGEQRQPQDKGGKEFSSSVTKETQHRTAEVGTGTVCLWGEWVLSVCHAQPCATMLPDGKDAGGWRAGPLGASEPADWQREGDDPRLLVQSLRELRWCRGGHTGQVFIFPLSFMVANSSCA